MFTLDRIILVAATTTTAMLVGLFYGWSVSVVPGLARLNNTEYISAFQAMNRAILNPLFFISFMGSVILLPLAAYLNYSQPASLCFWLIVAATILYIFGTFGITMAKNVPLNEMLDKFNLAAASEEAKAAKRALFEQTWNSLHHTRTVIGIIATVCMILACLVKK